MIADNLIVVGYLCIGTTCVSGEIFDNDTLRRKHSILRIHCDDTSTSSFPTNNWRIIANDPGGSANSLAIEDATAGRIAFRVDAGAPDNARYVASNGGVTFRIAAPVDDLYVVDGSTPTLRLQQDGANGLTQQIRDIAGTEAIFHIQNATTGGTPFRVLPRARSARLSWGPAATSARASSPGETAAPDPDRGSDAADAAKQPCLAHHRGYRRRRP